MLIDIAVPDNQLFELFQMPPVKDVLVDEDVDCVTLMFAPDKTAPVSAFMTYPEKNTYPTISVDA